MAVLWLPGPINQGELLGASAGSRGLLLVMSSSRVAPGLLLGCDPDRTPPGSVHGQPHGGLCTSTPYVCRSGPCSDHRLHPASAAAAPARPRASLLRGRLAVLGSGGFWCHVPGWQHCAPAPGAGCVRRSRQGINRLEQRQAHKFGFFFFFPSLSNLCLSQGCKTAFYCCLLDGCSLLLRCRDLSLHFALIGLEV